MQPLVDGLGPGTYQGTLTLQFSDGRVSAVGITFIVTATGGGLTSSAAARSVKSMEPLADAGNNVCNPQQLLPSLISLGTGFNVPAGYPQGLEATVVDNCGTPHLSGTVFVEFSNGDPPVKLSSLNNGRWQGTWVTGTHQVSQVTLTVKAQNPALQIKGEGQVTGGLGAQQPAPVVADNGVVSAASFAARVPLAPGGLISILGQRLSEGTLEAPRGALPSELASTIVTIGDQILPLLYASDTLVYAVAPYKLNANTNQQLLVQRGSTYATPVYVDVAAAQPALFQIGQTPIILDKNFQYITASNPAHAGDVLAMYSAGLGAVNPPATDGVPAPSPLSQTVNPVSVSIGGKNGSVSSAGLIPGLVGVYLINVMVPQGVPTGDQVPVVITAGGQASTPVTLSVR